MMRGRFMAVAVLAGLTAVGCGQDGGGTGVVVAGTPPATPYDGPLYVPTKAVDEDSVRATRIESGAAGRALECDGRIYSGGQGELWGEGDGGGTPEEGLQAYFDIEQPDVPRSGYRVEREEDRRVLFSYDVGGRTKVAVVVAKDREGAPGWGPETSASCDPAELPARFTGSRGTEIWTDRAGRRLPTTEIVSNAGAVHCDWQSAHFLALDGRAKDSRTYARDPDGVLGDEMLTGSYAPDVPMPAGAHDTGYRYRHWQLWLTDDRSTAYVRTPDGVEAWPMVKRGAGCA